MHEHDSDYHIKIDTRIAGQLKRYHTWPILGQQTVAEHTWQVLRIYMCTADHIDQNMVKYIMFHDIGEVAAGDLPFPVKRDNPHLKEITDDIENEASRAQTVFWGGPFSTTLSMWEKAFFKSVHYIEMAEFGMDQVLLGNSHALIIADRCLEAVYKGEPTSRLCEYVIKRLRVFFEQMELRLSWGELDDWWKPQKWSDLNVRK